MCLLEIKLIIFSCGQCGNAVTMNTRIAVVPLGFRGVISMWLEYLFLMAVVFI